jgi:hypothetical protein
MAVQNQILVDVTRPFFNRTRRNWRRKPIVSQNYGVKRTVLQDLKLKGKNHEIWLVWNDSETSSKKTLQQLAVSERIKCLWMATKVGKNLDSKIQFDLKKTVVNF